MVGIARGPLTSGKVLSESRMETATAMASSLPTAYASTTPRPRTPDIVDRLQSVTGLVTWFFLLLPGISFHVATPGAVKIDAR